MALATCARPGCENPPRQFSTICNDHINRQREVLHSLDRVTRAGDGVTEANRKLARRVLESRQAGATWAEIGRALGKSRQYAQRRFGPS